MKNTLRLYANLRFFFICKKNVLLILLDAGSGARLKENIYLLVYNMI